jgi:hypothetical protein
MATFGFSHEHAHRRREAPLGRLATIAPTTTNRRDAPLGRLATMLGRLAAILYL